MYVKFYLTRCRFALVIAQCLGGSHFLDTVYIGSVGPVTLVYVIQSKMKLMVCCGYKCCLIINIACNSLIMVIQNNNTAMLF